MLMLAREKLGFKDSRRERKSSGLFQAPAARPGDKTSG